MQLSSPSNHPPFGNKNTMIQLKKSQNIGLPACTQLNFEADADMNMPDQGKEITNNFGNKILSYTRLSSARGRGDTSGRLGMCISCTLQSTVQSKVTAFHRASKYAATSPSQPFNLGRKFSANLGVNERPIVSKFSDEYANAWSIHFAATSIECYTIIQRKRSL
jgi:hypothetical protein